MESRFQIYRRLCCDRQKRAVEDGEVVLDAANWHEFRDPESNICLEASDLEALGIAKELTREKVVECLAKALKTRDMQDLPTFTQKYDEAVQCEQGNANVISLEEVKMGRDPYNRMKKEAADEVEARLKADLAQACRVAIKNAIEFCGGCGVDEPEKVPFEIPKPTLWDRMLQRVLRLLMK